MRMLICLCWLVCLFRFLEIGVQMQGGGVVDIFHLLCFLLFHGRGSFAFYEAAGVSNVHKKL